MFADKPHMVMQQYVNHVRLLYMFSSPGLLCTTLLVSLDCFSCTYWLVLYIH
jgi:hypothetical protein